MSTDFLKYNKIKRERLRKLEIRECIIEMRKKLPVYTLEEIREHKMPLYDALVNNLEGKGFVSSASFLQQLVEFQTTAREEAGPGSNIWMRPQLRYSNQELKCLTEELRKAEEFHFAGNHAKECDTFLRLGIHFAFLNLDWWWLGEQILVQSINVSGNYTSLGGTFEALSRFAYAKFLIQNLREFQNAKQQLIVARELGKVKGINLESYFPDEKGTLYMKINLYTYECLIKDVRNMMKSDHYKAIEIAIQAKKRAAEACYKDGETNALLIKGLCEMNIDDPKSAILSFNKALKLQEGKENKEGVCQVMIQLAKAYLMDDNTGQSLRVLNSLKNTAAQYHLHYYLAEAYKNMGEYYLNSGDYNLAKRLFNKSINFFENEKDASSEIAMVQILEAIAFGLELFPTYVDLVYKAGNTTGPTGIDNLNKLLDWKDSREAFWEETIEENNSFADLITADCQVIRPSTLVIEKYKEERRHRMSDLANKSVEQGGENTNSNSTVNTQNMIYINEMLKNETELIQLHDNTSRFIYNMDSTVYQESKTNTYEELNP